MLAMEKQFYPRVARQFSAIIENKDGIQFKVVAIDASSEGFCIQCKTIVRNQITPGGSFLYKGKPIELFVWLELPFEDGRAEQVCTRCHVAFSRRISSDQCEIGMRYTNFDNNGYDALVEYIKFAAPL